MLPGILDYFNEQYGGRPGRFAGRKGSRPEADFRNRRHGKKRMDFI
jgi:hypothetical protein